MIVIGGGHAGTEAALASARMGCQTLLLTHNIETLGQMSCNPAIGGIGKSHLVKEIDALGGAMAQAADRAGIHFRTLNSRKGPAVRATRAQIDRDEYMRVVKRDIFARDRLHVRQCMAEAIITENGRATGVKTRLGEEFKARALLLTTGTFLGGLIHVGLTNYPAGRLGDPASIGLSASLAQLGFELGRLKTGTTPRLLADSCDFTRMEEQPGDDPPPPDPGRARGPRPGAGSSRPLCGRHR